ncbi:type I-B CRISPR-associated protein Cas5 [Tepiditoga spiralis]|uniref:Type I-B CRISPR-associated protein Cas5 n=1 Tax=Tepiditoga spiralis TaxID=2108365 RepID=A0A7G1G6F8_9BACT|nr:type I-B CRISPR-associated protein Cas5b [Tepiditoga spiralis]BBE30403.1 type I-B CRISPR-associated protein Cas5 [Tepiditoga spiralis]
MDKILVFDLWSDFGHFKVPYTTTSPLTFPVPPKTTVYGILSAILGLDKNEYLKYYKDKQTKIGISIKNSIQKILIPENLINTRYVPLFARMNSRKKAPRTQIRFEFLKNPKYRVFVSMKNNSLFEQLIQNIKQHKSIYTVSMGISECLANFKYVGEFDYVVKNKGKELTSIIPIDFVEKINFFDTQKKYLKIHLPTEFNINRVLVESRDFLIERTGKSINLEIKEYIDIPEINEKVVLF